MNKAHAFLSSAVTGHLAPARESLVRVHAASARQLCEKLRQAGPGLRGEAFTQVRRTSETGDRP